jgi:signal transduction histidine kinase
MRDQVKLWAEDATICLEVSDGGRGFAPADLEQAITNVTNRTEAVAWHFQQKWYNPGI